VGGNIINCPECGFKDLPEEASICPHCGMDLREVSQSATRITVNQKVGKADGSTIGVDMRQIIEKVIIGGKDEAQDQRNKKKLLEKVKKFWIEGVFEKSVHGAVLIDLGKETQMSAVERPWDLVVQSVNQPEKTLPPGKKIVDVFDEMGKTLLILGAPGSGKTTTLLELARDKIKLAESDPKETIPVVFNLSSWMDTRQSIADWLVNELNVKYQIPKRIGSKWVENNDLCLLLDGLDEVKAVRREACAEAINKFLQENNADIAMCSRAQEYQNLNCRLRLGGAIFLQPLTSEQIERYITMGGQKLAALAIALKTDISLQELSKSPLMLSIMSLSYGNLPVGELIEGKMGLEERRKHLFDTYVDRMFTRIGRTKAESYTKEMTISLLSWLAKKMDEHGQTVFLIEQLQPSWLASRRQRWSYVLSSRFICGIIFFSCIISLLIRLGYFTSSPRQNPGDPGELVIILFLGIIYGLIIGPIEGLRLERNKKIKNNSNEELNSWKSTTRFLAIWVAVAILIGLIISFNNNIVLTGIDTSESKEIFKNIFFSLIFVASYMFTFGQRNCNINSDIKTTETIGLSLNGLIHGAAIGIAFIVVTLGASAVTGGTLIEQQDYIWFISVICIVSIVFGAIKGQISEAKNLPNQGIKLSIRNSLLLGLTFGFFFMVLCLILLSYYDSNENFKLVDFIIIGISSGLIAFMWYGCIDAIQHYILRLLLWRDKKTPWVYATFLDYAVERIFLQKVGGGYIFIHRLFLEYFSRREDV
jgi:eukaryotic-like serine/threonine-protein kinase